MEGPEIDIAELLSKARDDAISKGIGLVQIWAGPPNQLPSGWLLCDGSALDSKERKFAALFLVIGTRYGFGENPTSFKVPDLSARIVMGFSRSETDYSVGSNVGRDLQTTTFTPSLAHQGMADAFQVNTENGFPTNPVVGANAQSISYDVRQASLVMSYIIRFE